jgi:hypothetical protein
MSAFPSSHSLYSAGFNPSARRLVRFETAHGMARAHPVLREPAEGLCCLACGELTHV